MTKVLYLPPGSVAASMDFQKRMRSRSDAAKLIDLALREKKPFSMIRLGDGESAILGYPEFESKERLHRFLINWFGPHASEIEPFLPLKSLLVEAISGADAIGTYSNVEFQVEEWRTILQTLGPKGPNPELNAIERKLINYYIESKMKSQAVCISANVHIALHRNGYWYQLVEREPAVTIVSCRPVAERIIRKFPGKRVIDYRVPGQAKFLMEHETGANFPRHFPDAYEGIAARLAAGEFAGPVLIGAGPCGKVYCERVRQAGGVAIDIGSIMDLWVGRHTRSYMEDPKNMLPDNLPA